MRKLLISLIGFLFVIGLYAQELKTNVKIDTLKVIQTVEIPTKEIGFGIPYGKVFISKASLIEAWDNKLALWKDELNKASQNKDWQIENYRISELYLEFVKRQKKLFFEYISDDSDYKIQQIEGQRPDTDTLYYMVNHLKEIVCYLIDIGEFEVQIDNKGVERVVKADVRRTTKYYETISTEYIVNDSIHFWICPPIIQADFVSDHEDMYVPEPPKD